MIDSSFLQTISRSESLENLIGSPCFAKQGVNLFAGLSGCGKTTYLEDYIKELISHGYDVTYFNYDESPMHFTNYRGLSLMDLGTACANATSKDVIIIDTLNAFFEVTNANIDDRIEAFNVVSALAKISENTGATFILVHHVDDAGNIEGSQAIYETVDTVAIFSRDSNSVSHAEVKKQRFGYDKEGVYTL